MKKEIENNRKIIKAKVNKCIDDMINPLRVLFIEQSDEKIKDGTRINITIKIQCLTEE